MRHSKQDIAWKRDQAPAILRHQSDLPPDVRVHPRLADWCRQQQHLVILQDGSILTDQPASHMVQNAHIVMEQLGVPFKEVKSASPDLIQTLLEKLPTVLSTSSDHAQTDQQRRLRRLVREAITLQATDIHIEVRSEIAKLRFRRHGELFLQATWQPQMAQELACVAFNKETDQSGMHFNPRVPQNAAMPLSIDGQSLRLRLASLPAHGGYDVVMRLLPEAQESVTPLTDLGYTEAQLQQLHAVLAQPQGAALFAGPTGSGKTTTLAACMQAVPSYRKIITIEDPVERIVANATQVPVSTEHADRDFVDMTRTALRMDPDVMVIGEMRDSVTATLLVRAALTGHLVFSTVHANNAIDIIRRLEDLGIPRSLLASEGMITALVSQRLVPVLCDLCSQPYSGTVEQRDQLQKRYGDSLEAVRQRGTGCEACQGCGLSGRSVVADIVGLDSFAQQCIAENNHQAWRQHLLQTGHFSLHDHAAMYVLSGRCDPADIDRVLGSSWYNTQEVA